MAYQPPYTLTDNILTMVAQISELVGSLSVHKSTSSDLRLRKINQVRTIQGSLAIEGNELTEQQITALLNGKRIIAPQKQVQEAHNALSVYEKIESWRPFNQEGLLKAHQQLMLGLDPKAGQYRQEGVGVFKQDDSNNNKVVHIAPPADRVPTLMTDLFDWLKKNNVHPLIQSSVFHYEFEFIHPFSDGNGRMGRLWQSLILANWNPLFLSLPVESFISDNQDAYYDAIYQSTQQTDSAPFIAFMLTMIKQALHELTPQVRPQVTPQVNRLLLVLIGEMTRAEIQSQLGLKDRKSFMSRYLKPALELGLIEMTRPDKPTSREQCYRKTLN